MKSQESKPTLFTKDGGVLSISGAALADLLQAVLTKDVPFRFRAKGFSMSPFVRDGDVVTLVPSPEGSPVLGDIVAYIHPHSQQVVLHRIIGKRGQTYLIKGDGIFPADGVVPGEHVLGRVKRIEREGRTVSLGLGPERYLVAFLNRTGLIYAGLRIYRRLVHSFVRRSGP